MTHQHQHLLLSFFIKTTNNFNFYFFFFLFCIPITINDIKRKTKSSFHGKFLFPFQLKRKRKRMRVLVLRFFMVSSFFPILGPSWATTFLPVYGFGCLRKMGGGGGLLLSFGGSLGRASRYGKKHCRILFWRIRAALKKALLDNGKPRFRFHYDPSSYALNFDDGSYHLGDSGFHPSIYIVKSFCYTTTTTTTTTTTWIDLCFLGWIIHVESTVFYFILFIDLICFHSFFWMFLLFVFLFSIHPPELHERK